MSIRYVIFSIIIILVLGIMSWSAYNMYYYQKPVSIDSPSSVIPDSLEAAIKEQDVIPLQILEASFLDENNNIVELEVLNASFLHSPTRNYYGDSAPAKMDIIWKHQLGKGTTKVGKNELVWRGAGWTGQPLLVVENGKKYLLQGAYDHHLKKIDAQTGQLIWQHQFDDVLKGTGSIWINPQADSLKNFCLILQGSRAGASIYASRIPSFRAISYFTGEECWSMNSGRTLSYSRDVDASCLLLYDTAFIGLENGVFTIFDPNPKKAKLKNKLFQPLIYKNSDTLYTLEDKKKHGGNLVMEASPLLLGNHIYLAAGSGHIWGYNMETDSIDWDFFTGSDIDGTPTITPDGCLLVSIEKQYIAGRGGLLKLDPRKKPSEAIVWFFPTGNRKFQSWEGGIIGSVSTNFNYKKKNAPNLAVFMAIDGFLYVINTDKINGKTLSFDHKTKVNTPTVLFKYQTGASISTPILVQNRIIAATYSGTYLFEFDENQNFKLLQKNKIRCESTPLVDAGRIYLPSRNGYLYCLGTVDSLSKTKPKK